MEIKNKPLVGEKDKASIGGSEKKASSLLKQRINNFLIIYFGYLTLVLACVIFAVGLFLFIYPQYQQMVKDDEAANKSLQVQYETQSSYLSAIRNLRNSYQSISGVDREKIEKMVPVGDKIIDLIPEIESMALKNSVVLNSIKIEPNLKAPSQTQAKAKVETGIKLEPPVGIFEQLPEGIGSAKIEINLSSVNYQIFKNLLKTFENNLRLLDTAKISYDVQENRVVLTLYSYYFIR